MIGSIEVSAWLMTPEYAALERALSVRQMTIEGALQQSLGELYTQYVPEAERDEIARRVELDRANDEQSRLTNRRFSAFHIADNGGECWFESDSAPDMLQTAMRLRRYLRGELERTPDSFSECFDDRIEVNSERFESLVGRLLDGDRRVVGVFDIDFDRDEFSTVHSMRGWATFKIPDISAAAYHANRGAYRKTSDRWDTFVEELDGKELGPDDVQSQAQDL